MLLVPPYYPVGITLQVYYCRMDSKFIERNTIPCQNLKGNAGTEPGDSG
jgi:hypothetical protein